MRRLLATTLVTVLAATTLWALTPTSAGAPRRR
jgi:hypothetical protein